MRSWIVGVVGVVVLVGTGRAGAGLIWDVTQITNNSSTDDSPDIDGHRLTWRGKDDGGDYDIYYYDGSTVLQVSKNSVFELRPRISGTTITWEGDFVSYQERDIRQYDASTGTTTILAGGYDVEKETQVDGDNVVWMGGDYSPGDFDIYLFNGTTTKKLTNNSVHEYDPDVSDGNVIWLGYDGDDPDIFFYNGTTKQLTNNTYREQDPRISGSTATWVTMMSTGYDSSANEIFYYDGASVTRLTDNSRPDSYPEISDGNVVWSQYDDTDSEILFYDGTNTTRLTDNSTADFNPHISGSNAVWQGSDGHDYEIFAYYEGNTYQLTDNEYNDREPRISGNNVVWYGGATHDGNEIFMATASENVVPEPTSLLVWSLIGFSGIGMARYRRRKRAA